MLCLTSYIFSFGKLKSLAKLTSCEKQRTNSLTIWKSAFVFVARCGNECDLTTTYGAQLYFWIFYTYIKGIPAIFTVGVTMIVSIMRLCIMSRHSYILNKLSNYKIVCSILLVFSAVFYLPNLLTRTIVETKVCTMGKKINKYLL